MTRYRYWRFSRDPLSLRAFTLVEIMLVVIILAVMAGAVVANMGAGYSRIAIESQAQLLADTVSAAHQYAQARCLVCRLKIDTVRGQYRIEESAGPNRPFRQTEGEIGQSVSLPSNVRFVRITKLSRQTGSDDSIRFFPDGASDPALVVLATSSGDERIVETPAYGGNAVISEPRR